MVLSSGLPLPTTLTLLQKITQLPIRKELVIEILTDETEQFTITKLYEFIQHPDITQERRLKFLKKFTELLKTKVIVADEKGMLYKRQSGWKRVKLSFSRRTNG